MRFLANRSELMPVVRRCSQTIGRYFESRERTCVLMDADQQTNTVMFTACGRSCTLQVRQPCRVEQSGKAMLFASVFQRILESFTDEVTFIASDDSRIEVRNAKALFEFPLLDVSKYPVPETPSPAMLLDCSGFAEVSAKVLFSAAQGRDTQAQLQCVHLIVHDGKFSASSCDGFRLTVASEDAAQDEPIDLLLPADAMKTMLAVFRGIPHCKIGVDGDTALFLGPNLVFTCQLSPYQAMNITPILEHFQPACEVHVDGTLLCEELQRVSAGSTAGARAILQTHGKGMVQIAFLSGDRQSVLSRTEFPADVRTPLPNEGFCYSYPYLVQAAKLVNGKETSLLADSKGTLMLRTGNELHVLMPTRMPQEEAEKPKRKKKAA